MKLVLCVMVPGMLLASVASAQVVEGYIQLPDSLGPISPPYHLTMDNTPSAERLFIGSEDGDVIVIDAVSHQRVARIETGPVVSLCYNSVHDKLYVATPDQHVVVAVDCGSYQVVKEVQTGSAAWVLYNPLVDRIYCGARPVKVIDCATDSLVDSVPVAGSKAGAALDSVHNKLYVGGSAPLAVVDCHVDSVVAVIERLGGTSAICCNSEDKRVYATASTATGNEESLYAVDTQADSVVSVLTMPGRSDPADRTFALICDPVHDRVFAAVRNFVAGYGCGGDTLTRLWYYHPGLYPGTVLAYAPELDKVYYDWADYMLIFDGATGSRSRVLTDGGGGTPAYLQRLRSLYCVSQWHGRLGIIDCAFDTVVNVIPLEASVAYVCMDTVDNKLYFALGQTPGYLGVIDCSEGLVQSIQMCREARGMVYDSRDDKLYVATWDRSDPRNGNYNGVSVYDCRSDSLIKVIPVGYVNGSLQWHAGLNKIYVGASDSLYHDYVAVIDCATDSITKIISRGTVDEGFRCTLLSPELNQFWGFSPYGYIVVDCLKDSVVMDTVTDYNLAMGICYSAEERKVYVEENELAVYSMTSLRPVGSVTLPAPGNPRGELISVPAAGKLIGARLINMEATDSVYALDTKTDRIVSRFDARHYIGAMCEDATGRYVYCAARPNALPPLESLFVFNTQCDSVVSRMSLPDIDVYGGDWLLPNRCTGLIYVGPGPNGRVVVLRDSVVIGLEEWRDAKPRRLIQQTVISRSAPLHSAIQADLFDASGRKAALLRPGLNDISRLAPGVYFIRQGLGIRGEGPGETRKIVLTE
jgi:DNA-binding beta-propeller fold protein YncE